MDRGFTVEGLTVTYMPRGLGGGNADTVQQRARFFGYKKAYIGYCRVFLEDRVRDAFRQYVEHEEDVRDRLRLHALTGRPLSEWKRSFFLARNLKPTRKSVLGLDYMRVKFGNEWIAPKAPHHTDDAVEHNRRVIGRFLSSLTFQEFPGHLARTPAQTHQIAANIPLGMVLEKLVAKLRLAHPTDSQEFTQLGLVIRRHLERLPNASCTIFNMSSGKPRERSVNEKDEIPNLFQGANYAGEVETYPGDMKIRATEGLSFQIHHLVVLREHSQVSVPAVTVWVPREMSRDRIIQPSNSR